MSQSELLTTTSTEIQHLCFYPRMTLCFCSVVAQWRFNDKRKSIQKNNRPCQWSQWSPDMVAAVGSPGRDDDINTAGLDWTGLCVFSLLLALAVLLLL